MTARQGADIVDVSAALELRVPVSADWLRNRVSPRNRVHLLLSLVDSPEKHVGESVRKHRHAASEQFGRQLVRFDASPTGCRRVIGFCWWHHVCEKEGALEAGLVGHGFSGTY